MGKVHIRKFKKSKVAITLRDGQRNHLWIAIGSLSTPTRALSLPCPLPLRDLADAKEQQTHLSHSIPLSSQPHFESRAPIQSTGSVKTQVGFNARQHSHLLEAQQACSRAAVQASNSTATTVVLTPLLSGRVPTAVVLTPLLSGGVPP